MTEEERQAAQKVANFKSRIDSMSNKRVGTRDNAYTVYPTSSDPVSCHYYDMKEVISTLTYGSPEDLRELSKFYYRYSGIYKRTLLYYANLLLFDFVVVPRRIGKIAKNKIQTRYDNVLKFMDKLDLAKAFHEITLKVLENGVYYGFFRQYDDGCVFQQLPSEYCRSRYKNSQGVDLLEFNLCYFDSIKDQSRRENMLALFPPEVVRQYNRYHNKHATNITMDSWYLVPDTLGVVFYFGDFIPLFATAIPQILRLDESNIREAKRDQQELRKLLINKMPIDSKTNEPVFSIEETAVIHEGMVNMLSDNDELDVITGFGDMKLEDTQSSSSQAQTNKTEKFEENLYASLGISAQLFNAQGNTALTYSVDKDTSMMYGFCEKYTNWLRFLLNDKFGDAKIQISVTLLPTTIHNRADMMDLYLKGAQYGYSKIFTAVAQGIKQSEISDIIYLENDLLDLDTKMVPLQSSHTLGNSENSAEKGKINTNNKDSNNEPGRPELRDSKKSDKTISNRDAM